MRKEFIWNLLVAAFVLTSSVRAEERPNFIVIMADDLGYGDLGCYGGKLWPTPNIDRLAREGIRFTDFHSSGPVCSPTRAGLLTGRYQQRAGVAGVIYAAFDKNRHHGLQLEETTFAEVLKGAGYATGIFGKWHLGYEEQFNPVHQGFDRYVGYVSGNVDFHSHIDGAGVFDWWHQNRPDREAGYTTHLITKHAVKFVRDNKDKPFCLYVPHEAPHDPYQGPDDPPVRKEGESKLIYDHRKPDHAARAYRDMMIELDKSVGEILTAVESAGIEKRTLILFFSDNGATGPGSCGGLYGMKGTLWEGGHRVPCIARWPGKIAAGSVSHQLATTIDVMPTLLQAAGAHAAMHRPMDGESLLPVMTAAEESRARTVFWQYGDSSVMRDGDWKLILHGDKPKGRNANLPNIDWNRPDDGRDEVALFDLRQDVREFRNLAGAHPERVASMRSAIRNWEADVMTNATRQAGKRPN
jgi:arylsulfatase A